MPGSGHPTALAATSGRIAPAQAVVVRHVEAGHRGRQRGQHWTDADGHYRHRDCYPRDQPDEYPRRDPQRLLIVALLSFPR